MGCSFPKVNELIRKKFLAIKFAVSLIFRLGREHGDEDNKTDDDNEDNDSVILIVITGLRIFFLVLEKGAVVFSLLFMIPLLAMTHKLI